MPIRWKDLPPDHPIFSTGPSFVFKNELRDVPAEDDEQETPAEENDDE